MDARARFIRWRTSAGLSRLQTGEAIGCTQQQVHRIESGARLPGRRLANAIERATHALPGGPIRAADWDALEDVERAAQAAAAE